MVNRIISKEKSRRAGKAIKGLLSAAVPQEALVGSVSFEKKKKTGGGRGRPRGTFKARYLPDGRIVKVPTHIYRRMLSEYKAKRRLAEAQRQAGIQEQYEAEQIAAQQRSGYEQPDRYLEGPDMLHEQRLQSIEQDRQVQRQSEQQPQPSFMQRAGRTINRIGGGINQITQDMQRRQFEKSQRIQQRQMEQGYPQPFGQQAMQQAGQQFGQPSKPQLRIIGNKSSILNTPNIFNNPRRH